MSESPASGSLQASGTSTGAPTAVRTDTSSQLGGRVIVMVTVAGAEAAVPSLAP